MPGGSREAWESVKEILKDISAKVEGNIPCCDYIGPGGSGHYVKMVHNGIEYGDMQLISEAYYFYEGIPWYVGSRNERRDLRNGTREN